MRTPLQCHCYCHFFRKGRCCYICTECKRDITLELVMLADIGHNYPPTHRKTEKGIEKIPLRSNGQEKV